MSPLVSRNWGRFILLFPLSLATTIKKKIVVVVQWGGTDI